MDNYLEHYRTLGVRPGVSWKQLRKTYKELLLSYHPDRFEQNEKARLDAEERTKLVNRAYQDLDTFYQQYGHLPLEPAPDVVAPSPRRTQQTTPQAAGQQPAPAPTTPSANKPVHSTHGLQPQRRSLRTVLALMLVGAMAGYLFLDPFGVDITEQQSQPVISSAPNDPPARHTAAPEALPNAAAGREPGFSAGATLGEVFTIQGAPTQVEGDIWYYGEATVHFKRGRVASWKDTVPPRLRTAETSNGAASAQPPQTQFGKGSTKAEVRAAQGTPIRETELYWDYGTSRVHFSREGLVTGWQESPFNPLRVRR